jgi:diguanylate cyclase (GGDEF)-like protein
MVPKERRTSLVRVLLVDDDPLYRQALEATLALHRLVEVAGVAGDGAEAVERALSLHPDVVVMDGLMPRLDGYEATRRLRAAGSGAHVLILTSSRDPADVERAREAGAVALLRKGESEPTLADSLVAIAGETGDGRLSRDSLLRLARGLSRAATAGGVAELVAREVAELTGAVAAVYLAAPDVGISLAAVAGSDDGARLSVAPGVALRAFRERTPVRATPAELARLGIPSEEALAAPLVHDGEAMGAVLAAIPAGAGLQLDPALVGAVADLAASAAATQRSVALTHAEARRDALTGLPNRRAFEERLAACDGETAVALIDVDDFKEVNDRHGHAAGDAVLRQIARIAQRALRASDDVYRLGGDELALVVAGTAAEAARLVERIREAVLNVGRAGPLPTLSAGVAAFPRDAGRVEELLERADAALYAAKRAGKNRVAAYSPSLSAGGGGQAPAEGSPGGGSAEGTPAPRGEGPPRRWILVVDDDEGLRALLRTTLAFLDARVDEAATAAEAVAKLTVWQPDAVVLDVGLPDGDGLTLCRRLKDDPATTGMAIIVLTGADAGIEAQAAGADAFLRKPFSPLELLSLVERLTGGAAEAPVRSAERGVDADQLLLYAEDLRRLLELELGQRELLQRAYRETVGALAAALESKDVGTGAHSQRVQRYAVELAWNLDPGLLDDPGVEYGFLLHDVGKIGIPDRILQKPRPLTPGEWRLLRNHTVLGEQLLGGVGLLQGEGLRIVRSHHERWDGTGYPDGLGASDIPVGARIFAVADALDAMTSDRPYRSARPWEAAAEEILSESGWQFDPGVVEAFVECEGRLLEIRADFVSPVQ